MYHNDITPRTYIKHINVVTCNLFSELQPKIFIWTVMTRSPLTQIHRVTFEFFVNCPLVGFAKVCTSFINIMTVSLIFYQNSKCKHTNNCSLFSLHLQICGNRDHEKGITLSIQISRS